MGCIFLLYCIFANAFLEASCCEFYFVLCYLYSYKCFWALFGDTLQIQENSSVIFVFKIVWLFLLGRAEAVFTLGLIISHTEKTSEYSTQFSMNPKLSSLLVETGIILDPVWAPENFPWSTFG